MRGLMKNIIYGSLLSKNLIKKRNFFVNLLILSALALVLLKNIDVIRYAVVKTPDGKTYTLDKFTSTIRSE